jgi:hypothetical protein
VSLRMSSTLTPVLIASHHRSMTKCIGPRTTRRKGVGAAQSPAEQVPFMALRITCESFPAGRKWGDLLIDNISCLYARLIGKEAGVLTGALTPRKLPVLAIMYMKIRELIGNSGDLFEVVCR